MSRWVFWLAFLVHMWQKGQRTAKEPGLLLPVLRRLALPTLLVISRVVPGSRNLHVVCPSLSLFIFPVSLQLVVLDGETRKMQHNAAAEAARVSGLELHHPASGTPQRPAAKGVSTSATPWASGQYQADSGNTNTRAHGHEALPVHAAHVPAGAGAAAGEAACAQEGAGKGLLDTASQLEGVSGRLGGAKSVGGVSGGMFDLSFRPAALDLLDADTL